MGKHHRRQREEHPTAPDVRREVVAELHRAGADQRAGTARAAALVRRLAPTHPASVRRVVDEVVGDIVASRVAAGWCPDDLDQLLLRRGVAGDRAVLAAWLRDDVRTTDPQQPWREQVERFADGVTAPSAAPDQDEVALVAASLHLGALLQEQNGLPDTTTRTTTRATPPRTGQPVPSADTARALAADDSALHRKLATVRGLLAKAESTTFDEEAEALSTKAQELISRYALERLLAAGSGGPGGPGGSAIGDGPRARRIWLDAPYVSAKAQLVQSVARANASRAVLSDPPGACTVVGLEADLDAVELLSTSLLVQANAAMLRHGRAVDSRGASRTRSFRRAFLMAFAVRIGERLTETAEQVLDDSGHRGDLLPVLRSRDAAVEETLRALVPHLRTTRAVVSNAAGWQAGHAAADLASIDVRRRLAQGDERAG